MSDKIEKARHKVLVIEGSPYHKKFGNVTGPFLIINGEWREFFFPMHNSPVYLFLDDNSPLPKFEFISGGKYFIDINNLVLLDLKTAEDLHMFLMLYPQCQSAKSEWEKCILENKPEARIAKF